jgi:hypothetical protein
MADSPAGEHQQETNNDGDMILDSTLLIPDPDFANIGGEFLDWNDPNIDFADFLDPQTNNETLPYNSLESSSLVRHSTPSIHQTGQLQWAIFSSNISIPAIPTPNIRSLVQRPKMNPGSQRIANLILHTLKSYPLTMLRHNILPPFIHPHLISSETETNYMEPITNCISLVHMISSGVQGSRKLFWKNVLLECEHLCAEVR